MRDRELRARWLALMRQLDVPAPLDLRVFADRYGQHRGRPIRLVPYPIAAGGPYGMWVAKDTTDFIMFQSETHAVHQTAIIAHEYGHMIAGHDLQEETAESLGALLPGLAPDQVGNGTGGALARSYHPSNSRMELEAETIATMIIRDADVVGNQPVQLQHDDSPVHRFQQALFEHRGWQ